MPDVALHLRALLGLVLVGLAQRLDVDRRAVQGRRDRAGEKRAVVVGVVPRQAAFVERVLPEALHELDRVQGLPGLEKDRKSTRLNSSHSQISYAVFCLKKKIQDSAVRPWPPSTGAAD